MAERDSFFIKAKRTVKASLGAAKREIMPWPVVRHSLKSQDRCFLFILTPPYSGSTALARVLNTASNSMILQERAEGQWLLPGLSQKARFEPSLKVKWDSVVSMWMSQVEMVEKLVGKMDVIIEKSPSSIVRADQLVNAFPNHKLVTLNRNPYANCASILYRHHEPEDKTEEERANLLGQIAARWVWRSTWIKKWIDTFEVTDLTYEQFCSDPQLQIQRVTETLPLKGVDTNTSFKVKDYPTQGISNQNARQIAKLSEKELIAISEELSNHEEILQFFGYTSAWQEDLAKGGASTVVHS